MERPFAMSIRRSRPEDIPLHSRGKRAISTCSPLSAVLNGDGMWDYLKMPENVNGAISIARMV